MNPQMSLAVRAPNFYVVLVQNQSFNQNDGILVGWIQGCE